MKGLLLIVIVLAVFFIGYFIMAQTDRFTRENKRNISEENRKRHNGDY